MANILETASQSGDFTVLLKAIKATELEDTLNSEGSFTVLAPTDDAFAKLPQAERDALFDNLPKLKRIVLYHAVMGNVQSDDLAEINEAPTVEGSVLAIKRGEGKIHINDALVTQMDILADNGVIHKIDTVLMPAILEHEYD
ncbi:fasciclin domain-containing protein [Chamaesiphon minutus]|uniref:Secreted/surface protein with fasciclin-like repeats n=1 Tax=Chamaesiphon minutus (strain ATCC 27169 / PCC 6605) TaxID=1173020 RepID=K9UCX6_CHAP6|nr:fasciclin domain-containing protein [Chamaesiphon minutus]AFY92503.1 secreted/surface protein with fasciclin-like repeats [Chamaesiphon minutus PCC 6605]